MSPPPFTGRPINGSLLLKVSEAAAALRISRSSLYRLFESGELAWVQIGASRRVTSAEIHRLIAAHTEAARARSFTPSRRRWDSRHAALLRRPPTLGTE